MSSTNSSESMGRSSSDDEIIEAIPMKQPATTAETETANDHHNDNDNNGEADESFLDDDFLSFSNVDNGGTADSSEDMEKLSGKKRERSLSPMPSNDQYRYNAQQNKPPVIIPWINNTATSSAPPPPPQQQWGAMNGGPMNSGPMNGAPPWQLNQQQQYQAGFNNPSTGQAPQVKVKRKRKKKVIEEDAGGFCM